jgi:broad specificity phosphatase PhoE
VNLTLVRHGEPVRGEPDDPGLSAEGADQARRAAEFLSVERYDALYVSPLRRALQTAEPIAAALGLHSVVEEGLAEFDRGMPYTHFEDLVDARDPRVEAFFRGDLSGWGADAEAFKSTVGTTIDAIARRHDGERVVLVSHGGVANVFFGRVLGLSRLTFHAPAYGSVSRARSEGGRYTLVSVNETGHLADRAGPLVAARGRPG